MGRADGSGLRGGGGGRADAASAGQPPKLAARHDAAQRLVLVEACRLDEEVGRLEAGMAVVADAAAAAARKVEAQSNAASMSMPGLRAWIGGDGRSRRKGAGEDEAERRAAAGGDGSRGGAPGGEEEPRRRGRVPAGLLVPEFAGDLKMK